MLVRARCRRRRDLRDIFLGRRFVARVLGGWIRGLRVGEIRLSSVTSRSARERQQFRREQQECENGDAVEPSDHNQQYILRTLETDFVKTFIFVTCMSLLPTILFAQAAPPPPPPRQEGSAEFAFVSTTGNSDTQTLGVAGEYHFRPELWHFQWKTAYVRNESAEIVSAEAFRFLFRSDRSLSARASAFGQYTYVHDAFAAIDHRNVIAGGLSYLLVPPAPHELWVDGGIGYTNEQRLVGDDISTAIGLTGLRYKFKLSDTAEVSDDLGMEFSFSNGDDWRLNNLASVAAKLTTVFALKLSYATRYVNFPAPGIDTTDTITSMALVAKF